jgi:hypothetical protein
MKKKARSPGLDAAQGFGAAPASANLFSSFVTFVLFVVKSSALSATELQIPFSSKP